MKSSTQRSAVPSHEFAVRAFLVWKLSAEPRKTLFSVPCRTLWCTHLGCFYASNYLHVNEGRSRWTCLVFGKRVTYASLSIDERFADNLKKAPGDCRVLCGRLVAFVGPAAEASQWFQCSCDTAFI
ncbi:hypothetical protein HPB50_018047 [Hyalomma asiaticum]|uniref:Uncharacterized protein n=1 Tax=Hyalomma asiaticum TaxID=266040 RepID=A0ACB7RVB1_HYAAI|nr:hypothetical protein HPB50_018047 [Hyalomma asiaticum]